MDFIANNAIKIPLVVAFQSQMVIDGGVLDLVATPFAPSLGTVNGDFTLASFVGYAAVILAPQPFVLYRDADAAAFKITMVADGPQGFSEVAGAIVSEEDQYGFVLHDGLTTSLLASELYESPAIIAQQGDGVVFPQEFLTFSDNFLV